MNRQRIAWLSALLFFAPIVHAQRAADGDSSAASPVVTRMMKFDKDNNGKLTKDEITDERLIPLFDRADTDKNGEVTKAELTALAGTMDAESGGDAGGGRRPMGGPGGGGGGGRGPGGFGGRGGGPPQPGQVMPPGLRDMLQLSPEQNKQLDDLQKQVDAQLDKILTPEQKSQLQEMRNRGPGGPGGPGGGRGGPPQGGGGPPERP